MITGWTLLLLAALVLTSVAVWRRRRADTTGLGTVSAAWIAEHNATESHYAGR
jgi:hypothetical protein